MGPSLGFMQSAAAFFYSGIFWMMVLFLIENRRVPPSERKPLVPLALVIMIGSAYLMLGVVAHQRVFVTPLDASVVPSIDYDTGRQR